MDFQEYAKRYGERTAYERFGLSEHMVFIVRDRHVAARCGKWSGSQPTMFGNKLSEAISILAGAIGNVHKTEEIILETS